MPHKAHILHLTRTTHLPRSPLTHTANHLHDCKALEPRRNLALNLALKLSLTLTPTLTLTLTPMLTLTPCKRRFAFSSTKHLPTSNQHSKQCHQMLLSIPKDMKTSYSTFNTASDSKLATTYANQRIYVNANLKQQMFVLGRDETYHNLPIINITPVCSRLPTPPPTPTIKLSPGTPHISPLISHLSPLMLSTLTSNISRS